MKRLGFLVLFLAGLSLISGYLLSKASWIGRVGMSLFYQQYNFLKVWWKGSLLIFAILMILLIIQTIIQKKLPASVAKIFHIIMLFAAIVGIWFTYQDFRHHFSHRLLGERFHIGTYLFWIGWISICIFYFFHPDKSKAATITKSKIENE